MAQDTKKNYQPATLKKVFDERKTYIGQDIELECRLSVSEINRTKNGTKYGVFDSFVPETTSGHLFEPVFNADKCTEYSNHILRFSYRDPFIDGKSSSLFKKADESNNIVKLKGKLTQEDGISRLIVDDYEFNALKEAHPILD
jgi:hypothetical protein